MSNSHQVGMLSFAKDLPNISSLLGLLCAMFGIYFAIEGNFLASIICVLWAVLFDWYDGIIARKMKGRTKEQGVFGVQLDSMIDIVSCGILPAVLLLSYGNYSAWFMPGAFIIVAAVAIRLRFLFESFFSQTVFSIILYTLLMILSALNLASIRTHKFGEKWIYALIAYVFVMTSVFGWILWSRV